MDYRQRFLKSLWYPEIYSRQERVAEAHQRTFQWVYEPHGFVNSARRWYNLNHWLEKDSGVYWISGKAGSGKSTLMNFIHRDNRTSTLLRTWAGGKKVLTPGFFFWNAGTTLERSLQGLLRSLLYQILQDVPTLTPISVDPFSFESKSALTAENDGFQDREQFAAWTERRLRTTFRSVMRRAKGSCHICVFIDGLDEISGDPEALIAAIKSMQSAEIKVCLSSRPDYLYTDAFSWCAKLRLQDLTEPDIRTYVSDRLQPFVRRESPHEVSDLMNSIVLKAQGVFLWVELVVIALIRGLRNNDTLEQLELRVNSMPSDIEALYAKMLSSIEVNYRRDAARLFQMALAGLTGSLLDVTLALYEVYERESDISIQKAQKYCRLTQDKLPTICAGFLEVHLDDEDSAGLYGRGMLSLPAGYNSSPERDETSIHERRAHIGFIHRTAVEFFGQSKQGLLFLDVELRSCPGPHSTYVMALLAKVILLGFSEMPANVNAYLKYDADTDAGRFYYIESMREDFRDNVACGFVDEIMQNVSLSQTENDLKLCDDVDSTLKMVYQKHQGRSPPSHWVSRWARSIWNSEGYPGDPSQITTSLRSSSPDSFYSARSESLPDSNRPIDFLGHAASYCLACFVLKRLDSQPKHLDKEYATYLLCCSVWALRYRFKWSYPQKLLPKQLDLVALLLRRGGNPNRYVEDFSTTIWGKFLYNVAWPKLSERNAIVATMKTFIENGADVHVQLVGKISVPESLQESGAQSEMYFRHELSVLCVLRSWLENTLELKNLEDSILANDGRDSHRYTHVSLRTDSFRPYKIPHRQHDKLVLALQAARHSRYVQKSSNRQSPEFFVRKRCARQLGDIYNKIVEKDGNSESCMSTDEDFSSSTDAEEEFHDSVTSQISVEVQDCQLIHDQYRQRERLR